MTARPWMPFYPVDFQLDTLDLDNGEIGVYMILICLAWRHGDGSVTGDMNELKITLQRLIAKFHGLTFNRIVPKLLDRYFEKRADGRFYQKRVEKELRKAQELSEKQSRISKERWSRINKNKELNDANALPLQSQSQSHTQEEKKVESAQGCAPAKKVSRGTRLPVDWQPSDDDFKFATDNGMRLFEIEIEATKFRNYWTAKSGSGATKLDWPRTWQNWILTATARGGRGGAHRQQSLGDRARELAQQARELETAAGIGRPPTLV